MISGGYALGMSADRNPSYVVAVSPNAVGI